MTMSRLTRFGAILACSVLLQCGENKGTGNPPVRTGNNNAYEFQALLAQIRDLSDQQIRALAGLHILLTYITDTNLHKSAASVYSNGLFDIVEYHPSSKYWVGSHVDTNWYNDSTFSVIDFLVDSMQCREGFRIVDTPSIGSLTKLSIGVRSFESASNGDTVELTLQLILAGKFSQWSEGGIVTVSGTGYNRSKWPRVPSDMPGHEACDGSYEFSTVFTNVAPVRDRMFGFLCPVGGVATYTGTYFQDCTGIYDSLDIDGAYTMTITYDDYLITYVLEDGATRWTFTRQCLEALQARPGANLPALRGCFSG